MALSQLAIAIFVVLIFEGLGPKAYRRFVFAIAFATYGSILVNSVGQAPTGTPPQHIPQPAGTIVASTRSELNIF